MKYRKSKRSGCKDIGFINLELVVSVKLLLCICKVVWSVSESIGDLYTLINICSVFLTIRRRIKNCF